MRKNLATPLLGLTLGAVLGLPATALAAGHDPVIVAPRARVVTRVAVPDRLFLPSARLAFNGGDVVLFFEAGSWWGFVANQLYLATPTYRGWELQVARGLPYSRHHFSAGLQGACRAGDAGACAMWQKQVRREIKHERRYRQRQLRQWRKAERVMARDHQRAEKKRGGEVEPRRRGESGRQGRRNGA